MLFSSRCRAGLLALPVLLLCAPAAARGNTLLYGKTTLSFHAPSGFVDSQTIEDHLFNAVRDQGGMNGELFKIYLPESDAQHLREGRLDAVNRQVALYGWPAGSEPPSLNRRSLDWAADSLARAWSDFTPVPRESLRRPEAMIELYQKALDNGVCLMQEDDRRENAVFFTLLIQYDMTPESDRAAGRPPTRLITALTTGALLVNGNLVFLTASSLIPGGNPLLAVPAPLSDPESDTMPETGQTYLPAERGFSTENTAAALLAEQLTWTKETAEAFSHALLSARS